MSDLPQSSDLPDGRKTIYDCERAKFEGFGTYKVPIEERVNEIMEATKKEYPNVYFFLLWVCGTTSVLCAAV
jgi:hypothetical protein